MIKIPHSKTDCLRVRIRLTCDDCEYPASEALYSNESEIPNGFPSDTSYKEIKIYGNYR